MTILFLLLAVAQSEPATSFEGDVRPLIARYCGKCHGDVKAKAGVNLSAFADEASALANRRLWKKVWDKIEVREMPPQDKAQPTEAERARMLLGIERLLSQGPGDPGPSIPRRLTRTEYNNTVADLLGFIRPPYVASLVTFGDPKKIQFLPPPKQFDAEKGLPDGLRLSIRKFVLVDLPYDDSDGAFDNMGEALCLPPLLLERYREAARDLVDMAFNPEANKGVVSSETRRVLISSASSDRKSRREAARECLAAFATRAFRRPATEPEILRLVRLFDLADGKGESFENSLKVPIKAVLLSPSFLFRVEGTAEAPGVRPVDDYELATRLSYFLWSTMPDAELFRLAKEGRLRDRSVLGEQVRRMVRDPRVSEFAWNFTVQWLRIGALGGVMRDPDRFPLFRGERGPSLLGVMPHEAILLFLTLLVEDRSILELIDPGFTYLSPPLATHYGIRKGMLHPGQNPFDFRRVAIEDRRRGGVTALAATLTATSLPNRTSPVKRGKWILETLLGAPPPPPQDDVPAISDAKPEADHLTIRKRMERHRADPTCASCHQRMDPLGLGLENYDGIGMWRDKEGPLDVDARATLPDGRSFDGPVELKRLLLETRRDDFVRSLVEHLLTYALGRKLDYYDLASVKEIVGSLRENGYRMSALVLGVARSYPFLNRRTGEVKSE